MVIRSLGVVWRRCKLYPSTGRHTYEIYGSGLRTFHFTRYRYAETETRRGRRPDAREPRDASRRRVSRVSIDDTT